MGRGFACIRLRSDAERGQNLSAHVSPQRAPAQTYTWPHAKVHYRVCIGNELPAAAEFAAAICARGHILDVLASHHVLVERDGTGDKLYSFQHQQFQEWYASLKVEEVLKAAARLRERSAYGKTQKRA
jgi:hypothetical protein